MYENIAHRLINAKVVGDPAGARSSLFYLLESIRDTVNEDINSSTFAQFISDEHYLFSSAFDDYRDNGADLRISTTGLIDQLLEVSGVSNHSQLSINLKNAIFLIHSICSQGGKNVSNEKMILEDILQKISDTIEMR